MTESYLRKAAVLASCLDRPDKALQHLHLVCEFDPEPWPAALEISDALRKSGHAGEADYLSAWALRAARP